LLTEGRAPARLITELFRLRIWPMPVLVALMTDTNIPSS
jgi:hypothetical protein